MKNSFFLLSLLGVTFLVHPTANASRTNTINNSSMYVSNRPALTEQNLAACSIALSLGDRGELVKLIQAGLMGLGFTSITDTFDGIFSSQTEAAVIAFQESKGLTADGVFGCATYQKYKEDIDYLNEQYYNAM